IHPAPAAAEVKEETPDQPAVTAAHDEETAMIPAQGADPRVDQGEVKP
ncbi:twin-arginine translocase subunit TatB, partial [Aeromonas sp. HMWF014]